MRAEAGRDKAQRRAGRPGCFHCDKITASDLLMMALKRGWTHCFACGMGYEAVSYAWRDRPTSQALQGRG